MSIPASSTSPAIKTSPAGLPTAANLAIFCLLGTSIGFLLVVLHQIIEVVGLDLPTISRLIIKTVGSDPLSFDAPDVVDRLPIFIRAAFHLDFMAIIFVFSVPPIFLTAIVFGHLPRYGLNGIRRLTATAVTTLVSTLIYFYLMYVILSGDILLHFISSYFILVIAVCCSLSTLFCAGISMLLAHLKRN